MPNPIVVERKTLYDKGKPTERSGKRHMYFCPGCDSIHSVTVNPLKQANGAGWEFTGTLEKPTYSPSQLTSWTQGDNNIKFVCHTFIREGMIQFLDDCTHHLKGQTVPMVELPDWVLQPDERSPASSSK